MVHLRTSLALVALALTAGFSASARTPDGKPLAVLIAGRPSHGPGEHEHNAGIQLFAKCLAQNTPQLAVKVHLSGEWPPAEELAQADTIVIYSDGGGGHPAVQSGRLEQLDKEMKRGCGFVCVHYAVEVPTENGGPQFRDWLGGYFEANWSVNPHWTANFSELPVHPISNGVEPFSTRDEWYYHMRFRPDLQGVTPILSDVPGLETLSRRDDPHGGNPAVRLSVAARQRQHVAWAVEREDGGRGFGFTGGHFHANWGNDSQRKLVLNAIVWTAKLEVPAKGVQSRITAADLAANLDNKPPRGAKPAAAPAPAPVPAATPAPPAKPSASNDGDPHAVPVFASPVVTRGPVLVRADLKGARELYLVVTDAGDGKRADWADWLNPTLIKADGSKVPLTSLDWAGVQQGHGSTLKKQNCEKQALKVADERYDDGIGTHAPSLIAYQLPEGVVSFEAQGAIDDGGFNQNGGASVVFQVYTTKPAASLYQATAEKDGKGPGVSLGWDQARENMKRFRAADGLSASLFASEPKVQNPTNLDIDPRGRLWVLEAVNYRSSFKPWGVLREEGDRIVILDDADGDGVADSEKVFFQSRDLTNPLGICVLPQEKGSKVIVSASPNVWLLTDTDGDDKADKVQVIAKVTGSFDHDHQIHAFSFGADGKFYFNFGNEAKDLQDPEGKPYTDLSGRPISTDGKPYRQGMVFRCDIVDGRLANIESLGWNFRNNYEVAVDSFGTMWQSDNDDDGNKGVRINYVMPFGSYGYVDEFTGASWRSPRTNIEEQIPLRHWHQNDPGTVPNLLQTGGGSPTGILVNESPVLGPQFENQLIHCDAGPHTVRAYPVQPAGAGYSATMVDILTSEDPWYRPSDAAIAPDGSLYIADWYDAGVGGHNMADHDKGQIRGRIYHVAPTGAKLSAPKYAFATAADCITALQSPARSVVYVAWQKLAAMGDAAEPELAKVWKESPNPRHRARALALLVRLPAKAVAYLGEAMSDANSDLRIAGIRLAVMLARTQGFDTKPLEDNAALMAKLMRDPNPQVRREIAVSLHGSKEIAPLWVQLALQHDGKDRWYLEALGIGAAGNEDACFDAWLAAVGANWNTPAGRDIVWRMRAAKAADYLARLIEDSAVDNKLRYFRSFDFLPASPERQRALVQLATAGKISDELAREALVRLKGVDLTAEPAVAAAMKGALEKAIGTPQFVELVKDFGTKGQAEGLIATAVKIANDPSAADALKLFFGEPNWQEVLDAAVAGPNGTAVLNLLGTVAGQRGLKRLAAIIAKPDEKPELKQIAMRALARTENGARALLALADEGKVADELKPTASAALAMVQYASLKSAIDKTFPAPNALGGQPLPGIPELVKLTGDTAKGQAIFESASSSCITCHRVGDKGVDFGPALTEIGTKLPKETIFESIINPNAGVSMGFETWQITLKDGNTAMGLLRSETSDEVVLALPGGATTKLTKSSIASRTKLPNSMMPSGLNQALSQQDLVDLVAYLSSLKAK